MQIRRARENNLKEILGQWKSLEIHYRNNPDDASCKKWMKDKKILIRNSRLGGVYAAFEKKKIIGYLAYNLIKKKKWLLKDSAFISELYVIPEARGRGVAKKLILRFFMEKLPKFIKKYNVSTHSKASKVIRLYVKFGFGKKELTKAGNILLEKEL